jgi:hypothetical protein
MYRYGDGTPFPLDENFIETLTAAVEACTGAFMPLTQLDERRDNARVGRIDADRELTRLGDLEKALTTALSPFMVADKKSAQAQGVAQKALLAAKNATQQARTVVEGRVHALEAQASASTAADAVLAALGPFFDHHQLPNAKWVMGWDVRGSEPQADAVSQSGRLTASFRLAVDPFRQPIRVDQLAEAVIVHMMKKGLLGKAKPAPVDLGKYVMVAFEKTPTELVVTLKEKPDRTSQGLRFIVSDRGATWQSVSASGEPDSEANPLDLEDVDGIRRLGEGANRALKDLVQHRTLVDIELGKLTLGQLPEPRSVPMEVLAQLTPLARTIRERSRMSGELVLKRDVGSGHREELFVPRAQLASKFARLPIEYRKPFEDMGIAGEDTQPVIPMPEAIRPPARPSGKSIPPPPPQPHARAATDEKTAVGGPLPEDLEKALKD